MALESRDVAGIVDSVLYRWRWRVIAITRRCKNCRFWADGTIGAIAGPDLINNQALQKQFQNAPM